jgi:hypothetical protein
MHALRAYALLTSIPNRVKYQDGSRYYGEVHDGLANGYGTLMNPDGSTYAGQHLKGARHGLGVYTVMVGEPEDDLTRIYSGEWLRGLRHGFAIERVMFKKKILKSCVVSNYEFDMKSISENINPGLDMQLGATLHALSEESTISYGTDSEKWKSGR